MRRFYIDTKQGLSRDLVLTGSEHNHLANVLRLMAGDEIIAVCGDEFDYLYSILRITKNNTQLKFISKNENPFNPRVKFTVYMGVIKHDNLALAVSALNEIGATQIVLFKTARAQNIPARIDKLQAIAQQSCKQCGRSIPLAVRGVISFEQLLTEIPKDTIFADEKEESKQVKSASAIIIGPEGGFTEQERELLRKTATPVSLGGRILRAETAAVVGAAKLL